MVMFSERNSAKAGRCSAAGSKVSWVGIHDVDFQQIRGGSQTQSIYDLAFDNRLIDRSGGESP